MTTIPAQNRRSTSFFMPFSVIPVTPLGGFPVAVHSPWQTQTSPHILTKHAVSGFGQGTLWAIILELRNGQLGRETDSPSKLSIRVGDSVVIHLTHVHPAPLDDSHRSLGPTPGIVGQRQRNQASLHNDVVKSSIYIFGYIIVKLRPGLIHCFVGSFNRGNKAIASIVKVASELRVRC